VFECVCERERVCLNVFVCVRVCVRERESTIEKRKEKKFGCYLILKTPKLLKGTGKLKIADETNYCHNFDTRNSL